MNINVIMEINTTITQTKKSKNTLYTLRLLFGYILFNENIE